MIIDENRLWAACAKFHGHVCAGLAIGFKASLYAIEQLDLSYSEDEDVVCIAECDTCSVDAIQVILGCSVGKSNLLFHLTGKSAYSFYNRKTGESVRFVLRPRPPIATEEYLNYFLSKDPGDLFEIKATTLTLPERSRYSRSVACAVCGEEAAEHILHIQEGKLICKDCATIRTSFCL